MPEERKPIKQRGQGRKSRAVIAAEKAGVTPLDYLLEGMRFYNEIFQEQYKKLVERGGTEKLTPEELKTMIMSLDAGREFAVAAAPYCHAKLNAKDPGEDDPPEEIREVETFIVDPQLDGPDRRKVLELTATEIRDDPTKKAA